MVASASVNRREELGGASASDSPKGKTQVEKELTISAESVVERARGAGELRYFGREGEDVELVSVRREVEGEREGVSTTRKVWVGGVETLRTFKEGRMKRANMRETEIGMG